MRIYPFGGRNLNPQLDGFAAGILRDIIYNGINDQNRIPPDLFMARYCDSYYSLLHILAIEAAINANTAEKLANVRILLDIIREENIVLFGTRTIERYTPIGAVLVSNENFEVFKLFYNANKEAGRDDCNFEATLLAIFQLSKDPQEERHKFYMDAIEHFVVDNKILVNHISYIDGTNHSFLSYALEKLPKSQIARDRLFGILLKNGANPFEENLGNKLSAFQKLINDGNLLALGILLNAIINLPDRRKIDYLQQALKICSKCVSENINLDTLSSFSVTIAAKVIGRGFDEKYFWKVIDNFISRTSENNLNYNLLTIILINLPNQESCLKLLDKIARKCEDYAVFWSTSPLLVKPELLDEPQNYKLREKLAELNQQFKKAANQKRAELAECREKCGQNRENNGKLTPYGQLIKSSPESWGDDENLKKTIIIYDARLSQEILPIPADFRYKNWFDFFYDTQDAEKYLKKILQVGISPDFSETFYQQECRIFKDEEFINLFFEAAKKEFLDENSAAKPPFGLMLNLVLQKMVMVIKNPIIKDEDLDQILIFYKSFIAENSDKIQQQDCNIFATVLDHINDSRDGSPQEQKIFSLLLHSSPNIEIANIILQKLHQTIQISPTKDIKIAKENKKVFNQELLEFTGYNIGEEKIKFSLHQKLENFDLAIWNNFKKNYTKEPEKFKDVKSATPPKASPEPLMLESLITSPPKSISVTQEPKKLSVRIDPFLQAIEDSNIDELTKQIAAIPNIFITNNEGLPYIDLVVEFLFKLRQLEINPEQINDSKKIFDALIDKAVNEQNVAMLSRIASIEGAIKEVLKRIMLSNSAEFLRNILADDNLKKQIFAIRNSEGNNFLQIVLKNVNLQELAMVLIESGIDLRHRNHHDKRAYDLAKPDVKKAIKDAEKRIFEEAWNDYEGQDLQTSNANMAAIWEKFQDDLSPKLNPFPISAEFAEQISENHIDDLKLQYLEHLQILQLISQESATIDSHPYLPRLAKIINDLGDDFDDELLQKSLSQIGIDQAKELSLIQKKFLLVLLRKTSLEIFDKVKNLITDQQKKSLRGFSFDLSGENLLLSQRQQDILLPKTEDEINQLSINQLRLRQNEIAQILQSEPDPIKQRIWAEEIRAIESGLFILFKKSCAKVKKAVIENLTEETSDIRLGLDKLGAKKVSASGSAVYYPMLQPFSSNGHFNFRKQPSDIDLFCILDEEKMGRLTSAVGLDSECIKLDAEKFRDFVHKNFPGYEPQPKLNKLAHNLLNHSISFSLINIQNGQRFDINIYNKNYNKSFSWQFGFERLELNWDEQGSRLSAKEVRDSEFDLFYFHLSTNRDNCFWKPKPNAKKFLERFNRGAGCMELPDLDKNPELQNIIKNELAEEMRKNSNDREALYRKYNNIVEKFNLPKLLDEIYKEKHPKAVTIRHPKEKDSYKLQTEQTAKQPFL